jgi:NDP-sugar pyrophosphorylase family protein
MADMNIKGKHILENAEVYGEAEVYGNAVVKGNAKIGGTAEILGGTWDGSEGEILEGRWDAPGVPHKEPGSEPDPCDIGDARNCNCEQAQELAEQVQQLKAQLEAIRQAATI